MAENSDPRISGEKYAKTFGWRFRRKEVRSSEANGNATLSRCQLRISPHCNYTPEWLP